MDTDGGRWTVFQRRKDGSVDFYRNWIDYEEGFGDLDGEFWLGLSKIHRLVTGRGYYSLRVDLEDFDNNRRYAKYSSFSVGDCATDYPITLGGYSGDAGDSMTPDSDYGNVDGVKFSTKDRDNDFHSSQCTVSYKGAWWYRACHRSNLNAQYLGGSHSSLADGINWDSWKGYYYSLKFTEMKSRKN